MKKSDVKTHSEMYRPAYPAVNVKYYGTFPRRELAEYFGVSENAPEMNRALEFAWESACEQFWESAQDVANFALLGQAEAERLAGKPGPYEVYSEGRSGGWLVVHGLPDIESWDAVMLGRWAKFAKLIRQDVEHRTSFESIRDDIEANEWLKPHAEKYNFIERDGKTECIADLKARAIEAGFGPVVRK